MVLYWGSAYYALLFSLTVEFLHTLRTKELSLAKKQRNIVEIDLAIKNSLNYSIDTRKGCIVCSRMLSRANVH